MKSWLEKKDIEMYSTHNKGKSTVAEKFIRILKKWNLEIHGLNIPKCVTDKLDDLVNKYNNTYHTTIKMKPVDVKPSTYIESITEINYQDPKFKIGYFVRISKYINIFAKGYFPNWSEEFSLIKKVKNTVPWTYVISDLKGEEIVRTFYKKELQKINQK